MIHDSWSLGGPLLWSGGDVSVSNFSSVGGGGASNITLDGGSATWTQSGGLLGGGYSEWESGNIAFSDATYYATYATLEGGSNTWVMASGSIFSAFSVSWLSGDISVDNAFRMTGTYSTMNFEGGDSTFTIAGTYQYNAGTINWTSGNIVLNSAEIESTGSPYTLTVPAGAELDINGSFSFDNANVVNDGTVSWLADSNDALADVTNNGDIVLDGTNPLVTLTGTGSATEGSAYTLNIGSVSGDVDGTVTDYIVDWGDGSGADDFTSAGDQTHTYAGNTTDPTDYTIQVHLITADGAYVTAATEDVSVADIAPVITSDDPGTTTTTPTLTGTAGIAPGDASTVTLNLYSGSTATGTPIDTETVDVDPDTGEFTYTVDPSSPLAAGTYTFQTTQDEDAGNTGTSPAQTFTVDLQTPAAPTSLTATPASPTEIDLSWDSAPASDFITSYSIYYSTDYGQTFTYYANTADGAATGMNITGLDPQTTYEFNVVANNASGSSPDEITPATSPLVDIEPPSDLAYTLIDGGLNGVNLTWTNNSTGQTAYQVEAKWAGTGQFVEIANLAATATSYTYTDEVNDDWATEPITFRVRAVGVGQSAYSADPDDVTATATFPDTGSVTDLAITSIDTSGVHFTFSQSGITEYDIIYRKQGATPGDYGTWRSYEITDNGGNDFSDPTIADTIQLPYLAWTDGVQLAVQAGGEGEGGPITNIVTASVPTMGLDAPTLTASVDSANSQIDLSWTSAGGDGVHPVTYSVLDMTPASDSIYIGPHLVTVTTDTSAVISLPEYGGYFAILATDTLGDTAMSSTTDLAIAKTPTGLSATNTLDEDGNPIVSLTWDNNSYNETGYEIERSTSSTDWDSDHDLQTFTDIDTDQGNYVDTTALADTTYYYRIQATRPDYVSTIDDEPVSTSLSSDYTMPVSLTTAPIVVDDIAATMNSQTQKSTDTKLTITNDNIIAAVYSPTQTLSLQAQAAGGYTAAQKAQIHWLVVENSADTTGTSMVSQNLAAQTGDTASIKLDGVGSFNIIVYEDKNGNGSYDAGEELRVMHLAIVKVYLTDDNTTVNTYPYKTVPYTDPKTGIKYTAVAPINAGVRLPMINFNSTVGLQGGGADGTIGVSKINSGWLGNFTGDTRVVSYNNGGKFQFTFPAGTPAALLDTTHPVINGGSTVFRNSSAERPVPAEESWERYVTAYDWPILPFNFWYDFVAQAKEGSSNATRTTQTAVGITGAVSFIDYLASYSSDFSQTYDSCEQVTWKSTLVVTFGALGPVGDKTAGSAVSLDSVTYTEGVIPPVTSGGTASTTAILTYH